LAWDSLHKRAQRTRLVRRTRIVFKRELIRVRMDVQVRSEMAEGEEKTMRASQRAIITRDGRPTTGD